LVNRAPEGDALAVVGEARLNKGLK
jgi:hypothetical protein